MRNSGRVRGDAGPLLVVSAKLLARHEPVYAIATSHGTCFVNGVLVSNCDALRYLLFSDATATGETATSFSKWEERRGEVGRFHGVPLVNGRGR